MAVIDADGVVSIAHQSAQTASCACVTNLSADASTRITIIDSTID